MSPPADEQERIRQVERRWALECARLLGTLSPAAYRQALATPAEFPEAAGAAAALPAALCHE